MMYGVATAANVLRNSWSKQSALAAPEHVHAKSALVSTFTERDAYSLLSLSA